MWEMFMYVIFLNTIGPVPRARGSNPSSPPTTSAVEKIVGEDVCVISYAELSDAFNF